MNFLEKIAEIVNDKTQTVVLYSVGGNCLASTMAAEKLGRTGYQDLVVYKDGIADWEVKGYPMGGQNPSDWDKDTGSIKLKDKVD